VDWIDAANRVLGQVTRTEMRRRNLLHRTVAILVQSSAGEVYVHRRSASKDLFPGLLDLFVGGVVQAGESEDHAAAREVEEELGIAGAPLEPLFVTAYEDPETRARIAVYRVIYDGPLTLQAEEVLWGGFVPAADLAGWLRREAFVPDGAVVFAELKRRRPDLLAGSRADSRSPSEPGTEPESPLAPDLELPETIGFRCLVCGSENTVAADVAGGAAQELVEDCAACCSPNRLRITFDPETLAPQVEVGEP
jgi:8-oxo-dGTP pyrophosphatase MutT (NUDIX family)